MLRREAAISLVLFFIVQTTAVLAVSVLGSGQNNNSSSIRNTTADARTSANATASGGKDNKIADIVQSQRGKSSSSSSSSHGGRGKGRGRGSPSKKHPPSPARFSSFSGTHLPIGYRYQYASDYDGYVSSSYSSSIDLDTDIDGDLIDLHIHEPIWFPLHYDTDLDLDLDFDDIDLDLDLLKLKYGLYGLNHYSLHNPGFNDYRFRRRYRYHSRPYFRAQHRYLPQYWKHDLDFWGLDNYGLGYSYDKYFYLDSLSTPISYSSVSLF